MKRYIIDAQTLQQSSFEFDLEVGNELFEAMEMTEMSEVNYNFHVVGTRLTTNKLEIEIDGEGSLVTQCDRCLDDVTIQAEAAGVMVVYFGDEAKPFDGEEVTLQRGDEFSIAQFVYDSIMLDLPIVRAHEPKDCNQEMLARISGVTE
ncbi:MAG: DUF177 domain-containing protein [Alistipes sp.]|nr:DUF177 domain-containing protein [Alistipes sp.]